MTFIRVALAGIILLFVFASLFGSMDQAKENSDAKAAGFEDAADRAAATKEGFTDPSEWRATVERRRVIRAAAEARNAREEAERRRDPADQMELSTASWTAGGFGSVGLMTLVVTNNNEFGVKDIRIKCSFRGASGTEVSSASHTIYDTVKPKAKRTFKNVNVGFINSQAARGGCQLAGASRM